MQYKILMLFLMFMFGSFSVCAGEIVATVNDEPISKYDVEARAKLIAIQKAEYLTNKRKAQYVGEALEMLIDEKVKTNMAKQRGFSVSNDEINNAISHLEKQNGLKSGEMVKMLAKNGVPVEILKNQIQADLMWIQVLQKYRSSIADTTPVEIEKKKNELRQKLREEEFFVFEILIPNKAEAEKCYKELLNGTPFDVASKKYSQSGTKETGGEVGWIKTDYYGKEISAVLRQMNMGDLSVPLKTKTGYLLLLLQDKKTPIYTDSIAIWELAQMAIPTKEAVHYEKQLSHLSDCKSFKDFARKYAIPESVKSGMVSPDQLPSELKDILEKEKMKTVIGPVRTPEADLFFMKCAVTQKKILPEDDDIKMQIETEKMEALSDKILRNAKRFAVIERK